MRIDTGEVEINISRHGDGEPLLLIHGLGMSQALWREQLEVFAREFEVVAVDLRGFGASAKPRHAGAYAVAALANDIAALIEKLDLGSAHILGTSMGGFVSLQLALTRADLCRSLILCHTGAQMSIPAEILNARVEMLEQAPLSDYAQLVIEQALSPNSTEELRSWVADMIANNDKHAYVQVLTEGLADFDLRDQVAAIDIPTQVIIGELDRVIPPAEGRWLAQAIKGAKLAEISAVGHLGYAEDPARFNHLVLSFLRAQTSP